MTRPALRIVHGDPTAEEIAVVAALFATAGEDVVAAAPPVPLRGRWSDPASRMRTMIRPGPGAWVFAAR